MHIGHNKDGFVLIVSDEPLRWVVAGKFYEGFLTAMGSPCCHYRHGNDARRSWAGWLYDHLPTSEAEGSIRDRFGCAQFWLLNNGFTNKPRDKEVLTVPLSDEQAKGYDLRFAADCIDLFSEPAL